MADIQLTGFINTIRFLPEAVIVIVDEFKKGYRKQNGVKVEDKYLSWKVIFKGGLKNYINKFFNNGMLVTIKGEALPYAIDKEKFVDGYSFIGQCINMASYPRASVKAEKMMIKESIENGEGIPDLEGFNQPDF